jgi:hypothetical protein
MKGSCDLVQLHLNYLTSPLHLEFQLPLLSSHFSSRAAQQLHLKNRTVDGFEIYALVALRPVEIANDVLVPRTGLNMVAGKTITTHVRNWTPVDY